MPETDPIARARQLLAEEMESAHAAFLRLHDPEDFGASRMECWKLGMELMSAQVVAANALKRLSDRHDGFTFTYVHQGRPARLRGGTPIPRNVKTTVPMQSVLNAEPEDAEGEDRS